ncbi:MAG: class I SAM-dependent methyltransferase [Planctomycetota bacterium]
MAKTDGCDDRAWLVGPEGRRWLAELTAGGVGERRLRRELTAERSRLVVEQVALRERARAKFGELAERMFFTRVGLEQATDCWVAAYKAQRFAEGRLVHDLCCGIGGDLLALAERREAVGVDRDAGVAAFAEANLVASGQSLGRVTVGDVEQYAIERGAAWHLDPDRRSDRGRSTRVELHSPGPELVGRLREGNPDGVVKLAPAAEAPSEWEAEAEREWITRGRECRQQAVWFGGLPAKPGCRRATVVRAVDHQVVAESFSATPVAADSASEPAQFLYDPDPSVVAAGLAGAFATQHGLQTLGPSGVYLTGPKRASPLAACFRVGDVLPLREKAVGGTLRAQGVGIVEIKQRGVGVDPERFRKSLKLQGDGRATLVLTRVGERRIAVVTERVSDPTEGG